MIESVYFPRLTQRQIFNILNALEFYITAHEKSENFSNSYYASLKETKAIVQCAKIYPGSAEDVGLTFEDADIIESALLLYSDLLQKTQMATIAPRRETSFRECTKRRINQIPQTLWKIQMMAKGE